MTVRDYRWWERAACRDRWWDVSPPEGPTGEGQGQQHVMTIEEAHAAVVELCYRCPVIKECYAEAARLHREERRPAYCLEGVWGGALWRPTGPIMGSDLTRLAVGYRKRRRTVLRRADELGVTVEEASDGAIAG